MNQSLRALYTWIALMALVAIAALPAGAQQKSPSLAVAKTVSDAVARAALAQAARFADVTYEFQGSQEKGVAYKWGGRSTVDEYLRSVSAGAVPGEDIGADASAVVVNAYLAADPQHRFTVSWEGRTRLAGDATSADLYRWNVEIVPYEEMRPGDLIFFQNGAGQVSGVAMFERRNGPNVHFIVASAGQGRVIRTFLNVNNAYWNTRVKAAGRLLANHR